MLVIVNLCGNRMIIMSDYYSWLEWTEPTLTNI